MADDAPEPEPTDEQVIAIMVSRQFVGLLVLVSVVGVVVSFATWGFLELIYQVTQELYTHLPHALGYPHGPPVWWPLPVLFVAGVIVALAITRLPGNGGHIPANGLQSGGEPPKPIDLPGVAVAGLVGIGFGIVLGPEAPLMAIGPGLAVMMMWLVRRDAPHTVLTLVAASGAFAAVSFLFVSPLIAAVMMIEVTAIGGLRRNLIVIPGLLSAGIGSLLAIGMGSWTGLNRSAIALAQIQLPHFARPTVGQFGWTIVLALLVGVVAQLIMRGGLLTHRFAALRPWLVLPAVGLIVAGLAIAFSEATGKSVDFALFSGESGLASLVAQAGAWSLGALALLILFKGLAYCLSLGSFRGGPTFPAIFLGAAAGLMAARLPGFSLTPAVAVGMGAAMASVLKLPLSSIVLATLLTTSGGTGDEPLIIVGVVVAYLVAIGVSRLVSEKPAPSQGAAAQADAAGAAAPGATDPQQQPA